MMQQQMSQGAMAALKRAMGQYGGQLGDTAGQMMAGGAARPAAIGGAAAGLGGLAAMAAPMMGGAPSPAPPMQASDAPIQPSARTVSPGSEGADPIAQRAMRIMREAQMVGDASPATLQKLTDELFSFLPEGQRQAIVAQAMAMSGGEAAGAPQQSSAMPPGM